MNAEDYPSDSDEFDEEYKPENDNDYLSDSAGSDLDNDENNESDSENDNSGKSNVKRKRKKQNSTKKKLKTTTSSIKTKNTTDNGDDSINDGGDEEKSRVDSLWADFLATDDSSSKSTEKSDKKENETANSSKIEKKEETTTTAKTTKLPTILSNRSKLGSGFSKGTGAASGLQSVLGIIGKKSGLSTLEKSKSDWNKFKTNEGISEEIQTHNKGKAGYLDKQDFLQRTDLRQFEIEKEFRQSKRK
uniref:Craniofacial development protein 1 n=1 Tax=Corethrella appendiculata TaxID=1370023 RepID=U5EN00_9DIPT